MIRLANIEDLDCIMPLFKKAQLDLRMRKVNQWQNGYPNVEIITKDIEQKKAYVLIDEDRIKGYYFMDNYESDYDYIEEEWLNNYPYIVIHRICIDLNERGLNLGNELIQDIKNKAKKQNKSIRIDTHKDNDAMNNFLIKHEFKKVGIIYLKNHDARNAYHYVEKER